MGSRYSIGVDLGTTNCAIALFDTLHPDVGTQLLRIPQLSAPGNITEAELLPSFLYFPVSADEGEALGQVIPEQHQTSYLVGQAAKNQLALTPGRVIHSAKSWFVRTDLDRTDKFLPWTINDVDGQEKLSPIEVATQYLQHIRHAWNNSIGAHHPDYRFEQQQVVLTVPASFDEAAQLLTLQAAQAAGFSEQTTLLEEPQAAFYDWLQLHQRDGAVIDALPRLDTSRSQIILVCDVGGGTSDFSLFEISPVEDADASPELSRLRVSDHILLGGDNIDLTLARRAAEKLNAPSSRTMLQLVAHSREIKEQLLSDQQLFADDHEFRISVTGEGSNLFAATQVTSLQRSEIERILFDEFFPTCAASEGPRSPACDIPEVGLPYASDTAVTRHLAGFLDGRDVDALLFTGGTLKPPRLRGRITSLIESWQSRPPVVLENSNMDFAVCRGAAYYGTVRHHRQKRIRSGAARSVYAEVSVDSQSTPTLVCILPHGTEPEHPLSLEQSKFRAVIDQPVQFRLLTSTRRDTDQLGQLIEHVDDSFHQLPPMQTILRFPADQPRPRNNLLDVRLDVVLRETGVLDIACVSSTNESIRWPLEFNLRKSESEAHVETTHDNAASPIETPPENIGQGLQLIRDCFGKAKQASAAANPKQLRRNLEELFGPRGQWSLGLLRGLWPELASGMTRKGRSLDHETAWLFLTGFSLRPGFGTTLDPTYIEQAWRVFDLGLKHAKEPRVIVQWYIMWRRIAGGLNADQQEQLFARFERQLHTSSSAEVELLRFLCALERLSTERKEFLGNLLLKRLNARKTTNRIQYLQELGRLGRRVPLAAPALYAVAPDVLGRWFEKAAALDWSADELKVFHKNFSQACRITNDETRDLDVEMRAKIITFFKRTNADASLINPIEEFVPVSQQDREVVFGEELPSGLRLG